MVTEVENDKVIQTLDYDKKVMAEEVLHANAGGTPVKILPTQPVPDELPPKEAMVPIYHKTCDGVAFYYTHRLTRCEVMTASRARDIDGNTIEPSAPMICGTCGFNCGPGTLEMRHES